MQDRAFFPVSKFQAWAEWKAKRARHFKTLGANYLVAFIRCTLGACNGCNKAAKACHSCPLDKLSEQAESIARDSRIDVRETVRTGKVVYKREPASKSSTGIL